MIQEGSKIKNNTSRLVLAHFLSNKRKEKKLSLRSLYKLSGVSHQGIANIESGLTSPQFDTVMALFNALNTDLTEYDKFLKEYYNND